jgi:hypothetical protein
MAHHEGEVLAPAQGMPLGTALHLRMEVESILAKLPEKHRKVLALKFGLHDGTGEEAAAEVISKELGIEGSEATKRRAVLKLVDEATKAFKRIADSDGAEVSRHIEGWTHEGPAVHVSEGPTGPSHRELVDKFGSDQAVHHYHAAVRAGQANVVEPILLAQKRGTATPEEITHVGQIVHAQRDRDRLETWKRFYQPQAVDPKQVRDIGPQGRSAYDTAEHDYMVTVAKHGHPASGR